MKLKVVILSLIIFSVLLTGCGRRDDNNGNKTTTTPKATQAATPTTAATQAAQTSPTQGATDAVTTASIVDNEEAFIEAIGTEGTWIICLLNDLETDQELVLEGEYKNGKKDDAGNDIVQRKIALYSQDEERNVTARFTLTAPKLTVRSPKGRLQSGIFKGDLYVDVNEFALVDQTIEGNVYFTKQEYMDSFIVDETSKITGKKELVK